MTSHRSKLRVCPSLLSAVLATLMLLTLSSCSGSQRSNPSGSSLGEWHEFDGTWTAAGTRNVMRLDQGRKASIAKFTGSLVLAGASKPALGFRSEAILFNDSATGLIGRAVWADEQGNKAYSELRGDSAADNKIIGTFVGGTGRYAGATGTYEFTWRFLIENEEGEVQGQSVGLRGRVRVEEKQQTASQGDLR